MKKRDMFLHYHVLLIIFFSSVFYLYAPYSQNKEDITSYDSFLQTIYYTTTTHFTIGFGDITPKSSVLRILSMIHIFLTFLLFSI